MRKQQNKRKKDAISLEDFGNMVEIQDFETKLQGFMQSTSKIIKQKTEANHNGQVSFGETDLDYQAIILDKLIRKSMNKHDLKLKYLNICAEFGIDYYQLMKLDTLEKKQDYAVGQASKAIKKNLDSILSKYENPKQETQSQEKKKNLDLYGWLKVKSQYGKLKEILQYALVELVQETSNQDKIKLFFAYLNRYVKRRHKAVESLTQSTAYSSRLYTDEDKLVLEAPKFKFQQPDMFFEWNQAIEKGFINVNNNIHRVGYEMLKKQNKNGVDYQKREKLLDQCQEGNYITADELKMLASTSYLINRCVDKEFIQRAINFLDSEVIHQIEMNIADQILYTYYFLKQGLTQQRKEWLEKINAKKRQQIKINSIQSEKKNKFLSNAGQVKLIKKKIINQLKDVAKKKQLKIESEKKKERYLRVQRKLGNPLANIYVQKFKEIVLSVISKLREKKVSNEERQKEFLQRNEAKPPPKPVYKIDEEIYDFKKSQKAFHPPSKIMTRISEDKYNIQNPEQQKQIVRRYRMGIRNYTVSSEQFKDFYTGGPQLPRQYQSPELQFLNKKEERDFEFLFPRKHNWITAEAEIQAANKIKFAIKRYLQKKALDKLITKTEVKKNRDIEIKIRKCMQAKKFFEELHKELDKRQTEKLKDLSSHQPPKLPLDKLERRSSGSPKSPDLKSSEKQSTQRRQSKLMSHRLSLLKPSNQITITQQSQNNDQILDTARRAEFEIKEIARKKKMMKFSKQKEMSEAKLKNRKLIVAAKMKNLQIAMTAGFIYNQKDTQLQDRFGNTPLYYSAKNGDEQFCRFLLKLGADVNQQCENLNTPLHMAFQSESKQIIIDFIHKGGNLNVLNADKCTPLAFCSEKLLRSLNLFNLVTTTTNQYLQSDNHQPFKVKANNIVEQKFEDILVYDRYKHKTIY